MAKVEKDIKGQPGLDVDSIKRLPGYAGHKVVGEGDGKGNLAHEWLVVDGVDPQALDQVIANYDHDAVVNDVQARRDLSESDKDMARRAEEVIQLLLDLGVFTQQQLENKSKGITALMAKRVQDRAKVKKK